MDPLLLFLCIVGYAWSCGVFLCYMKNSDGLILGQKHMRKHKKNEAARQKKPEKCKLVDMS
ncbi:hypothetical protein O3M35_012796 [Rhynocoris fuscipes]|uniref:Uncharacterized protein n=1 Tax=Rhynocoris fuscipes TaxID=488301 RepID=A0AAW1CFI7_9HEMI